MNKVYYVDETLWIISLVFLSIFTLIPTVAIVLSFLSWDTFALGFGLRGVLVFAPISLLYIKFVKPK